MGYDLIELIAALSQRKRPNMFLWNLLVRKTNARKTAKFEVHMKKSRRDMAPFVSKYVNGTVMKKDGAMTRTFQPPQIKPIARAHANELLEQNFGQDVYGNTLSVQQEADIQVAKELNELDQNIVRRELWMLSKAVTTGAFPIIGESIDTAFDYKSSVENFKVLSGADLFTDINSDPYTFIKSEQMRILKETGILVDSVVLGSKAADAFMRHPKIVDHYKYRDSDVTRIQPKNLGDGAAFLGTLPELNIDIYSYIDWVIDPETDKDVPLLPENGMLMIKSKSMEVDYGAFAQIPYGEKKAKLFIGERIPKYFIEGDSELLRLASAPLPLFDDVDGFSFTTVI